MDESFILEIEVCQLNEALDLYMLVLVPILDKPEYCEFEVHSDVSNR